MCQVIELTHRFLKCAILVNDDSAIDTSIICDEKKTSYHRVISVLPIRTIQEVSSLVNSSNGGLSVSLWSNDAVEIISLPFHLQVCAKIMKEKC